MSNPNETALLEDPINPVEKESLPASFSALDAFKNQTNTATYINAKESADKLLLNDGINPTSFIQTFNTGILDLKKRKALKLAQVSHSEEQGIIEVIIKVDPNGNVISAEANGRKTNTSNHHLKILACNAALNSFFEPLNTNEIQTGSIIYNFDF